MTSGDLVRSFLAHKIHCSRRFTSPAVQKPVSIPTDLNLSFSPFPSFMSGLSPVRRLRTKTSDISDFFRGSSSHPQRQSPSTDLLQQTLPQQVNEPSTPQKAKRSRIPFLGRSKKKSSQPPSDGVQNPTTLPSVDSNTLPSEVVGEER